MNAQSPTIGIFDSGAGGLIVMREVMRQLPHASIIYFGDTAHLPYGDKSPEVIKRYACASVEFLTAQEVNLLIVACNTASACAIDELRCTSSLPIIDVIAPSATKACRLTKNGKIAVLGTHATIRSEYYQSQIEALLPYAEVTGVACPLFVPLVEEQMAEHPATELIVRDYLRPLRNKQIDTVILGCTHYPALQTIIARELDEGVHIVNSASCCASHTYSAIAETTNNALVSEAMPSPSYAFFVSDNAERFHHLVAAFLPKLSPHIHVQLKPALEICRI